MKHSPPDPSCRPRLRSLPALMIIVSMLRITALAGPERGETLLRLDFNAPAEREAWSRNPVAKWTEEPPGIWNLSVDAAGDRAGAHMVSRPVDLTPWRGMVLRFECEARAEDVSRPAQPYNGVKFMLHFKAPGGEQWRNQDQVHGTFDWKKIGFDLEIPADAGVGELCLGLQDSTGRAAFRDITVRVRMTAPPARPAPDPAAPPAYKGHNLPRLRGVMSPNSFRDEDLRVLGTEWKANLIRWQITRNWGKAGTEMDLTEYDRWIDAKLDELDQVMPACARYGIKVVIDLHTPPGGRDESMDMTMFYDRKYQDHFVAIWEKIARRYKGQPALWGYDLVNEPVCAKPTEPGMDSLATQVRAARAIRLIDPFTPILIAADQWDSPGAFTRLEPVAISNVVYQVHMYVPHSFTHQGVNNDRTGIEYPGTTEGRHWDKEALRKVLQPVRDFQQAYNVHIYAGEFSAIRWAPGAERYLDDCISLFEEYEWDWSYHAYREWDGWSLEHGEDPGNHDPVAGMTARMKVLRSWFGRNEPAR